MLSVCARTICSFFFLFLGRHVFLFFLFFFFSLIHTAQKTIMPFDRLVRSTLGLCDSFTPGDCCGDGHIISTFYPPDTQILTKDYACVYLSVFVSVCVVEQGYIVGGRVLLFL